MARGGTRVGAGRKPEPDKGKVVRMPQASPTVSPAVSPEEIDALLEPPTDLDEGGKACWVAHAKYAIAERTLTPATAAGFRQFCQQWAYVQALAQRIDVLGPASKEASAYIRDFVKLSQRLDGSLARFKLTAFGKPVTSDKPKPAANPWAQAAQ